MLYHLSKYLETHFDIPGAGMFQYLSFRAAMAIIFALMIGMIFGKQIIRSLQKRQIGEEIRNLGLEGQLQKKGTPTMGGIIILASILVPILLFGNLSNIYVILMIASTIWLGLIGFIDDYIKVFKKNKAGLHGKFKIIGQVGLGIIVGITMWSSDSIVVREKVAGTPTAQVVSVDNNGTAETVYLSQPEKTTKTTIPFFKDNEFDYSMLVPDSWNTNRIVSWLIYIFIAILIITGVSNAANLTDGLDGLAAGVSAAIGVVLGILAYLSGNAIYAEYLNIMYIPESGELLIYAAAFMGALLGFLWYNGYPAQVFMGDTGSLAIGGAIAVFALLIRKELLLPILCGVFMVEGFSVVFQVVYFKYTKKKYGEGRRIFLMSPLHHHFQKKGYFESKIVL
ncbi:MAG: phospho-N-acetylmuramoyl-pentapeptide-transferase, partial [Rikenellaceae bacterium]|nr:phospho-N-acetylmuramoyl-pentapeptide-transferase [Rikenellaceae bacterium]